MKAGTLRFALLLWGLSVASAVAQDSGTSERRIALPDHGYFVIQVPRGWVEHVRQPPGRLPPTVSLTPESGKPFQVLATPIWPMTLDSPPPSRDQIRSSVERAAESARSQAVEKELTVVEFQGRSGPGFYFAATDRAPKPGEFELLAQGILLVGELSVAFTILTNEGQEQVVEEALDVLKNAVHAGA
jgi:hypothetical protein